MPDRRWDDDVIRAVEAAVSAHAGRSWQITSQTDLSPRSSHPAMIFADSSLAVFAKWVVGQEAAAQVDAELAGLRRIAAAGVATPIPIGGGRLDRPDGSAVLLFEAVDEHVERSAEDWAGIGRALAALHGVRGPSYGAPTDGFFGPLRLDNAPVEPDTWAEFYARRRVEPWLRAAYDRGVVDPRTAARIEALLVRLPDLAGPDPGPRLLHGDAQHHNFLSTSAGAMVIDASPYFGHPELDLALLDYFSPVPVHVWSAYAEICPIDPGLAERRELWRIFAYLGILTVDSVTEFGRSFGPRLQTALDRYLP